MKICPKCNSEVADNATFCTSCGAQLNEATASSSTEQTVTNNNPVTAPVDTVAGTSVAPMQTKKKDNKMAILAIVAAVSLLVALGSVIFTVYSLSKKDDSKGGTSTSQSSSSSGNSAAASGVKVALGEYEISIPGDYIYETEDDAVIVTDKKAEKWAIGFCYYEELTISMIENNLEALAESIKASKGLVEVKTGTEKVGKDTVPFIDIDDGTQKATYAFFEADNLHVFEALLIDASGDYNHDLMKNAQKILKTAKKKTSTKAVEGEKTLFDRIKGVGTKIEQ